MLPLFKYQYIILKFIQNTSAQNTPQQLCITPNTNTSNIINYNQVLSGFPVLAKYTNN